VLLLFRTIHDVALMMDRERVGREASPTAGTINSQSVMAPNANSVAKARARRSSGESAISPSTATGCCAADDQPDDRRYLRFRRSPKILDAIRKRRPWLKHLFEDGAYGRDKFMGNAAFLDFVIEIARRIGAEPRFKVLPRRWLVERTFSWMTRWRRLVRDYQTRCDVSEAMIHVATGCLLLRRIAHE
jgi:hypothetical protein